MALPDPQAQLYVSLVAYLESRPKHPGALMADVLGQWSHMSALPAADATLDLPASPRLLPRSWKRSKVAPELVTMSRIDVARPRSFDSLKRLAASPATGVYFDGQRRGSIDRLSDRWWYASYQPPSDSSERSLDSRDCAFDPVVVVGARLALFAENRDFELAAGMSRVIRTIQSHASIGSGFVECVGGMETNGGALYLESPHYEYPRDRAVEEHLWRLSRSRGRWVVRRVGWITLLGALVAERIGELRKLRAGLLHAARNIPDEPPAAVEVLDGGLVTVRIAKSPREYRPGDQVTQRIGVPESIAAAWLTDYLRSKRAMI